jgi:pyrophosphate--fructose-6-phosphate 1-phosphotransferase
MDLVKDYLDILKEEGRYRLGIKKSYFQKMLTRANLDPDTYGPLLFENYGQAEFLLRKTGIISVKTLRQSLEKGGLLKADDAIAVIIEKIYKKSVPSFKTQIHFYGYDGRGNDPTRFDCIYTYNLGRTVFSLIANGATGQMAAIRLMHLEERKGKLALVLEKSIVDVNSIAFQVVKANREKWLAVDSQEDHFRRPGPIRFTGKSEEERPITLELNALADQDK